MSNTPNQCELCGTPLSSDIQNGLCPGCLMRQALDQPDMPFPSDAPGTLWGFHDEPEKVHQKLGLPGLEQIKSEFPNYDIKEMIGFGGMGVVYRATQKSLARNVALKILPPDHAKGEQFEQRFVREAKALASLNHTNIVTVHETGQSPGGFYYFIMEYVDGMNLRQLMRTQTVTPELALNIVQEVCDALIYAHGQGIIHRDIKPENIMLSKDGHIKIADFGLAKLAGNIDIQPLTQAGVTIGTPNYMAPEQFSDNKSVDHRADIYSLGVVFYELLTGELPMGRFAEPSKKVTIDIRLDDVVLKALASEPEMRYQQVSDVKAGVIEITKSENLLRHPSSNYRRHTIRRGGITWFDSANGIDPATGRLAVAKGVIACGEIAVGGIAIGRVAIGGIACGGFALGVVSVGGIAAGLVSLAGIAIGILAAFGGLSIGALAVGGMCLGGVANGEMAFGFAAAGDMAKSYHHVPNDILINDTISPTRWMLENYFNSWLIGMGITTFLVLLISGLIFYWYCLLPKWTKEVKQLPGGFAQWLVWPPRRLSIWIALAGTTLIIQPWHYYEFLGMPAHNFGWELTPAIIASSLSLCLLLLCSLTAESNTQNKFRGLTCVLIGATILGIGLNELKQIHDATSEQAAITQNYENNNPNLNPDTATGEELEQAIKIKAAAALGESISPTYGITTSIMIGVMLLITGSLEWYYLKQTNDNQRGFTPHNLNKEQNQKSTYSIASKIQDRSPRKNP